MIKKYLVAAILFVGVLLFVKMPIVHAQSVTPVLYFSDITSGPNTGGQNNAGVFVTIYGNNFGTSPTVTVGGGAATVTLQPTSWMWYQKMTIQLTSAAQSGNIVLTSSNGMSNGLPFTVRAGNIYFVSTSGNDSNAGTFAAPWKTILHARNTIVAGDTAYAENGVSQNTDDGSGWNTCMLMDANAGTASNPKAIIGYPGATATIGSNTACGEAIRSKGTNSPYWVFAELTMVGQSITIGTAGDHDWRIIGNDLSCPNGNDQAGCLDIGGQQDGTEYNYWIYANNIHNAGTNNTPGSVTALYHGVYLSQQIHTLQFAWNTVANVYGGRCIQENVNNNSGSDSGSSYDLHIHDNVIHDCQLDGIVMTTVNPSKGTVEIYNNIIYNAGKGPANAENSGGWNCLNIQGWQNSSAAGTESGAVQVYNNSMYACGTFANPPYTESSGGFLFESGNTQKTVHFYNNIIQLTTGPAGLPYMPTYDFNGAWCGTASSACTNVTGSNNDFYGMGGVPTNVTITGSLNLNPQFDANFAVGNSTLAGIGANFAVSSGGSSGPAPDVTPPTVPTGLAAGTVTASTVALSWNASNDPTVATATVSGLAGYKIFRNGVQVGTTANTTYTDSGLTASTNYTYTVSAYDNAGNTSSQSGSVQATTSSSGGGGGGSSGGVFVQENGVVNGPGSASNISLPGASTAGDVLVLVATYDNPSSRITSITDARGDTFQNAIPSFIWPGSDNLRTEVWYAKNIAGGSVVATANFSPSPTSFIQLYLNEYSGLATSSVIDQVATTTIAGTVNGTVSTPSRTTTAGNEIVFGHAETFNGSVAAGTGFTARSTFNGNMEEDKTAATIGSQSASFTISGQDAIALMVTLKTPATSTPPGDTTPPTTPTGFSVLSTTTSTASISWSASTDNIAVTGYKVFRGGVQIATTSGTSFINTGLAQQTTYTYTVAAYDAVGNTSAQSASVQATTLFQDTTPPVAFMTAPANGATVSSTITLTANASDNVAIASVQFKVDGTLVGSPDTTPPYTFSWSSNSVANGLHTISALAKDTSNNQTTSATVTVTVSNAPPADTTPPSTPTGLSVVNVTTSTVSINWNASTDNVGVTGYKIFRGGVQVGTSITNSFIDTALTASTTYAYTVSAFDIAGNNSALSSSVNGTTQPLPLPGDITPPSVAIVSPANSQTVTGVITLTGSAADNVLLSSVQISIDSGAYGSVTGSTNWTSSLDTTGLSNGNHTITAKATDNSGNTNTVAVTVNVQNATSAGGGSSGGEGGGGTSTGGGTSSGGGGGGGGGGFSGGGTIGTGTTTTPTGGTTTTDNATLQALLASLLAKLQTLIGQLNTQLVTSLTRTLTIGSYGTDVQNLQRFLNDNGYTISATGAGSPGNEVLYFGAKTAAALAKWQAANGITPASGILGPKTMQLLKSKW